jgi:predicted Zn-dependent peptidase
MQKKGFIFNQTNNRNKMKYKLSLVILFIVASVIIKAQNKIEFTEYNLDNGLHVILHQDNSTPIVAITTTYHVGSKNEFADRTGFAHFFEHLMFEGTENIKRGEIDQLIQNAGGQLNAATSFDQTNYYFLLPSNQVNLGLWIESERMLHAKIDSVGVETQRKVVKEERRQRIDNQPYGSVLENIFGKSYTEHPYRWTPIGSFQYIDKATIDEFRDFYKTFYVPNNAVLSIAGDFKIDEMKALVAKYFAEIPKGTKEIFRPKVVEPQKTAEVKDTIYDKIQLPAVISAYHIPAQGTDDYYALNMLTTLLSGGQSSRLYKEIVDNKQLAVYSSSIPLSLEDPGLFIIISIAAVGKQANEVDEAINDEIEKVKLNLIDQEEFDKLKNQTENDFVRENNTVLGIARNLANYNMFFGNTNLINTEIERFMKVTREDIKRVANKYLVNQNRTVLYYLPNNLKAKETK